MLFKPLQEVRGEETPQSGCHNTALFYPVRGGRRATVLPYGKIILRHLVQLLNRIDYLCGHTLFQQRLVQRDPVYRVKCTRKVKGQRASPNALPRLLSQSLLESIHDIVMEYPIEPQSEHAP